MTHSAKCPECDAAASSVARSAPLNIVRDIHAFGAGPFFFCASADCEVVYFDEAQSEIYRKTDVRVLIGVKETGDNAPVCYCFDFTRGSIRNEIERDGTSTVPDRVKAGIAAKKCACETRNPQGSCCLGNVNSVTREIQQELQK